ncbi:MAG: FAD-dependent oxidoreductase [Cyanobacteria bacterium J06650_10]
MIIKRSSGKRPLFPTAAENFTDYVSKHFEDAWANYGDVETSAGQTCLNYGRLPEDLFMINWPHKGNDYGVDLSRLIASDEARAEYGKEAKAHSQAFACFIQQELGDRYGLAQDIFPKTDQSPGGGFALMPYYRESRRVIGLATVSERDILPREGAQSADLPINKTTDEKGEMDAIALGNYPNDHHYPGFEMPLAPKAIRWGGRWTGTPFTIPYRALVPKTTDGLLVCEKNISVSHIANGATRLQPVVLGIGQAAGMAAALCVEHQCEPRALDVKLLQTGLILDAIAPAAVVPLFNLPPGHPEWAHVQQFYLVHPSQYAADGYHRWPSVQKKQPSEEKNSDRIPRNLTFQPVTLRESENSQTIFIKGVFSKSKEGTYQLHQNTVKDLPNCITLVTIRSEITDAFGHLKNEQQVHVLGTWNLSGKWLLCLDLARV